jgi:hypothetical protein
LFLSTLANTARNLAAASLKKIAWVSDDDI